MAAALLPCRGALLSSSLLKHSSLRFGSGACAEGFGGAEHEVGDLWLPKRQPIRGSVAVIPLSANGLPITRVRKGYGEAGQSLTTIGFSAAVPGEDAEWGVAWVLLWA
jgi:hypothetical protein